VRLVHPEMKLTSEWLAGDAHRDNNPDRHIVARTNVVIDLDAAMGKTTNAAAGPAGNQDQKWHVTSDQAVYDYHVQANLTNAIVTISGHAIATNDTFIATGEPLIYDLVTRQFSGSNYETKIRIKAPEAGGTNAPAKTNLAPVPQ
jgi:hypothetical protein